MTTRLNIYLGGALLDYDLSDLKNFKLRSCFSRYGEGQVTFYADNIEELRKFLLDHKLRHNFKSFNSANNSILWDLTIYSNEDEDEKKYFGMGIYVF